MTALSARAGASRIVCAANHRAYDLSVGNDDWDLKPHTLAKHKILRHYLGAWFAIMAHSGENRMIFLDGFAGRGKYTGGEPGSPIIALEALVTHRDFPTWASKNFVFVFVEPDDENFENLCSELDAFWNARGGQPENVVMQVRHSTFVEAADDILESLGTKRLAPTFALIDPFGWDGLPLDTIARLLSYNKCEVFVNFMIDFVNRFIEVHGVQSSMRDLFGTTDEHIPPEDTQGTTRQDFLLDLYRNQLRTRAGFRYIRDFQMVDGRNKPLYHLVYGTRHLTGLDRMKQAMWDVDPSGGIRFSDRADGKLVLFGDDLDPAPLIATMRVELAGKTLSVKSVEDFVIEHTPYTSRQYNRAALNPMEREGLIEVLDDERKRPYTFPKGTKIYFPPV